MPYLLSTLILLGSIPVVLRSLEARSRASVEAARPSVPRLVRPNALHAAVFATSLGAALFFIVESAWSEVDLGMSERRISAVVILLGVGEVVGALASAAFSDRLGKRVAMAAGLVVLVPSAVGFAVVGDLEVAAVTVALLVAIRVREPEGPAVALSA